MKNLKKYTILGLAAISLASCTVAAPFLITDNANTKTGEASYSVILGFIAPKNADGSIQTAAKNGGITKVSTVDIKVKGGLLKKTYSTVVTGE